MPVPPHLDYDMWLGPTPEAEYTEHRVHPERSFGRPGWLQIEAYCRGMITGWGAHMYDIAQWGLGVDHDGGPIRVRASAAFPDRGLFDVHTNYSAEAEYANGVKLLSQTGSPGVKFIGADGWVRVWRGGREAHDPELLNRKIDGGVSLYRSSDHMLDFLKAMRSRKDPICPVEVGHRSNSVCIIHHIAMKLGRPLNWDAKAERFVNDEQANGMLDYPHRVPWTV